MPAQSSWILQLPRIRKLLEALDVPVIDRASVEKIFGVKRRRAIQLMHAFGGYQAGRTFLVERSKVLRWLKSFDANHEWELARRTKLVSEIEREKKLLPSRRIRIATAPDVLDRTLADLPPGIHLQPGQLLIEFHGTEDLLRHLFELSQAIVNDYSKFEKICEAEVAKG